MWNFVKFICMAAFSVILVCAATYAVSITFDTFKSVFLGTETAEDVIEQDTKEYFSIHDDSLEISDKMMQWSQIKEEQEAFNSILELPDVIVKALYVKCGTNASYLALFDEYKANKSYYLSIQISDQLSTTGLKSKGLDGDKIESVTINTKLKDKKEMEPIPIRAVPDSTNH